MAFLARSLSASLVAMLAAGPAATAPSTPPRLELTVHEGRNLNVLLRQGPVAAHLVLRDGPAARLLVAFPAGNSGAAAWFAPSAAPVHWSLAGPVRPVTLADRYGRPLNGITAEVSVSSPRLALTRTELGSVRVLRDVQAGVAPPTELATPLRQDGARLTWARDRIDGAAGYLLSIEVLGGRIDRTSSGAVLVAAVGRPLRLRVTAATGEPALTPLDVPAILTSAAGDDARARLSLGFLSYREKLLAGSWRFDTYFGRDTLMSVRLLLPVLRPEEAEAGLGAVLARLSPQGEVAHEEDIGEFAILDNMKAGRGRSAAPVYDYKMIDGDYLLAPVIAAYAERFGQARLATFLAARGAGGSRNGDLLVRNLRHVLASAHPFAVDPRPETLLHLKPGVPVGQWRDSNTGLGGGRIPYDVNAVLVPAALSAAASLARSGALAPYADAADLADADRLALVWRSKAPALFAVTIGRDTARTAVEAYARASGVDPAPALASLPGGALDFPALSLDAAGRPIAVLHTDISFDLLFGMPAPETLERLVANVMRPFPAGLMTEVGPVVADAAFADPRLQPSFAKSAYHGAVIWAWQEAALIAGIDRQLDRSDLPPGVRRSMTDARARLWAAVQRVGDIRTSELWSWRFADGRYQVQPFGAAAGDADESNAAQLWSTVFLALGPTSVK